MIKIKILFLFFLIIQTDWVNQIENRIQEINVIGTLRNSGHEETGKGGSSTMEMYDSKVGIKISGTYVSEKMDLNYVIYESENLIIAEIVIGIDPLIYKTERKTSQPYAVLKEKRIYFKKENEGIEKTRKINLYESDNIEQRKKELNEIDFEREIIGGKKYKQVKERFETIKNSL